ncbi:hypothetical protein [Halovivax gelatinilyticus]|uniref:hypothetical protein n=1 Tax=Halovivax gelatinilyticus TaxID=2961597 RepID=UPI0020CA43BB|nr:hypothetical protein [Halovivax gelatinilyticus]
MSGRHEGFEQPVCVPFDNYVLYQSVKDRIGSGTPWEETELYERLRQSEFNYWQKYESLEAVDQTLSDIDSLIGSIKREGYKPQTPVTEHRHGSLRRPNYLPPKAHEVAINIGRDGNLIFDDGRHRFVVAKALGISEIPVRVFVRHEQWQAIRSEVATASRVTDLSTRAKKQLDHPDIQEVAGELV